MHIENEKEKLCLDMMRVVSAHWRENGFFQDVSTALGIETSLFYLYFPGGIADVLETFAAYVDREMVAAFNRESLDQERTHEKIRRAVFTRLIILAPYHASLKGLWVQGLLHPLSTTSSLYTLTDTIWRLAGDQSTDFNFYSKRGLLGVVYTSTFLYWLKVGPACMDKVGGFLDQRLANVMVIPKVKEKIVGCFKKVFS